jgi:hypothetical protein
VLGTVYSITFIISLIILNTNIYGLHLVLDSINLYFSIFLCSSHIKSWCCMVMIWFNLLEQPINAECL